MKHYKGFRDGDNIAVFVNEKDLNPKPSQKVYDHSPNGFEWGYGGSGPAQLALGILLDFLGDEKRAVELHQRFKWEFIATADKERFDISGEQISAWLADTDL